MCKDDDNEDDNDDDAMIIWCTLDLSFEVLRKWEPCDLLCNWH